VKDRSTWIGVLGGGTLFALGLGALIYFKQAEIETSRGQVAQLRTEISTSRKLIEGTGALEREVIVLREMADVIQGILPTENDINNLVRTFNQFEGDSGVKIRKLERKPESALQQEAAFDQVAYTLTLEGDAFQLLDFTDRVETHSRFMRVPRFKITAAKRQQFEQDGFAAHRVRLDVETFYYDRKNDAPQVRLEGYERKRDLMAGEINRRRQDLTVASYSYGGPRARRDPWVDPRVPVMGDGESVLPVQEQMDIVQTLVQALHAAQARWQEVRSASNVVEEMVARSDLEKMMAHIEEDVRRLGAEGSISYVPSQRRLQIEVVDALQLLRQSLTQIENGRGPSIAKLREVLATMSRHMGREEYALVLDAYKVVDGQLEYVETDPGRKPLVDEIRRLAQVARIVLDFDKIPIDVTVVAILADAPSLAIINGKTLEVGDMLDEETVLHGIRQGEIEFLFRGVILARRF